MMRRLLHYQWILLFAACGALAAQEEAPAGGEFFIETVDVNVVNVEVFVTDRAGDPVTGLTAGDFEIFEDRRPVAITNFYEVSGGLPKTPVSVDLGSSETASASGAEEEQPGPSVLPENQKLYLVVYVDNFNIRPLNRNRVLRRVREFLYERVEAADQVMLVSYDRSLNVRHPFTSDSAAIGRALFELEELTGHAVGQDADRREILEAIDEAEDVMDVDWRVRQHAEALSNDLSFTLDALRGFVESLSGLEGRKAILYVSDGLQMTAAEDLFQALMHKFVNSGAVLRMQDYNALRGFRELASLASSNRVSFYTIDAAGLRTSTIAAAESRGAIDPGFTTLVESSYRSNLQAPLRLMAEETGGQAIINTNDVLPGLDRMRSDFESFYSIGYMPVHESEGRYHRIEVRLKEPMQGVKVRHRAGYRSKSLYAHMADATRSALLYGFERNPLGVGLRTGRGRAHDGGLYLVPIAVDIPIDALELVPQGEAFVGRLKLYFAAFDEDERISDMQEVPLPVEIPAAEIEVAREHPFVYQVELQMRPGAQRMAVGVRDEIGAEESFVVKTVRVGG